jgi:hypothetical protein
VFSGGQTSAAGGHTGIPTTLSAARAAMNPEPRAATSPDRRTLSAVDGSPRLPRATGHLVSGPGERPLSTTDGSTSMAIRCTEAATSRSTSFRANAPTMRSGDAASSEKTDRRSS